MKLKNARPAKLLAALLAVALGFGSACGDDVDDRVAIPDERRAEVRADLDWLIESGLARQLPPPMPREEQELYEVVLDRRQLARKMAARTASALTPLAVAAAVFVPQGPADVVLAVFPWHHIDKAADVARTALRIRALNKRSGQLIKLHERFEAALPEDARAVFQLARKLGKAEREAVQALARHTGSPSVVTKLMTQHVRGQVDVAWVASKLEHKGVDRDFIRRFTFDADFVEEFTTYEANLSWSVLKAMVEGRRVDSDVRTVMVSKLRGLLGERAAGDVMRESAFMARYFKGAPGSGVVIGRGVGYRTISGRTGSIDIMARSRDQVLFAEVKNLAAGTWSQSEVARILAQLKRHNRGIEDIVSNSHESGMVAGKVLMVAEDGFKFRTQEVSEEGFRAALGKIGWTLEFIPNRQITSVNTLIDSLR